MVAHTEMFTSSSIYNPLLSTDMICCRMWLASIVLKRKIGWYLSLPIQYFSLNSRNTNHLSQLVTVCYHTMPYLYIDGLLLCIRSLSIFHTLYSSSSLFLCQANQSIKLGSFSNLGHHWYKRSLASVTTVDSFIFEMLNAVCTIVF